MCINIYMCVSTKILFVYMYVHLTTLSETSGKKLLFLLGRSFQPHLRGANSAQLGAWHPYSLHAFSSHRTCTCPEHIPLQA